jgi:fructosamine-3-kinase
VADAAPSWFNDIETTLGSRPIRRTSLSGGSIATVDAVDLADGRRVVVKTGATGLPLEAKMLAYLTEHSALPVPRVLLARDGLLVMDFLPGTTDLDAGAEAHAAELLASLHAVSAVRFGFAYDTVIGGLPQPNPQGSHWIPFFRDHRLLHMARDCHEAGELDGRFLGRIECLAEKLDHLLEEPDHPSLIHGDMWGGNILSEHGRVTGFLDPAIYYAHAEIELAFSTLFGTFHEPFFKRYHEIRPIRPGFFEVRKDIYNLWHLLTHVRLFGAGYLGGIDRVLTRHGL